MIKSIPRFADSPRDSTNKLPNDVGAGPLRANSSYWNNSSYY